MNGVLESRPTRPQAEPRRARPAAPLPPPPRRRRPWWVDVAAHVYVWCWWNIRMDPTGYLRPTGLVLGSVAAGIVFLVATFTFAGSSYAGGSFFDSTNNLVSFGGTAARNVKDVVSEKTGIGDKEDENIAMAGTIPSEMLTLYRDAASSSCDMDWELLAGVGWVETHHGQLNAAGVTSGANYAGAMGPMQFLSDTWRAYGVDGDNDGRKDVYNKSDAIHGAAKYLCANGAGDGKVRNALWNYNRSTAYANDVLAAADGYRKGVYVLPLPSDAVTTAILQKPHHDYPASDLFVPSGTTVLAVHEGKVRTFDDGRCGKGLTIFDSSGVEYTYCHLSKRDVKDNTTVHAGDVIGKTGGGEGEAGAGSSSDPHLHLQIRSGGALRCPQSLLTSWAGGKLRTPESAPTSGCST